MQISELSDRSGLTVQTIKYYMREGLLPRGAAAGSTRAEYDRRHLERLRLIKALRELGGLPVATVKRVVGLLDDERVPAAELIRAAQHALGPHAAPEAGPDRRAAREDVAALLGELGWQVSERAPARELLAQGFVELRRLGFPITLADLRPYIRAAGEIAEHGAARLGPDGGPRGRALHCAVVSTAVYEQVLIALHRLAQEHAAARHFGAG
ncbi:MerR family transcriptional regulator [Actinomadura parmotrematis]|uniref:MerR family transcriptional regulator n=1 Tax=Actinomadura parmotrematis TaxID=2864039 RepID=A0ABS7G061_9ACTN|nr:MerR family transcriptional regulator [Actinomadura parmotrematis]MBW8486095.1 MerR family transcriptional regulator [Actinomadura parmotrematis]